MLRQYTVITRRSSNRLPSTGSPQNAVHLLHPKAGPYASAEGLCPHNHVQDHGTNAREASQRDHSRGHGVRNPSIPCLSLSLWNGAATGMGVSPMHCPMMSATWKPLTCCALTPLCCRDNVGFDKLPEEEVFTGGRCQQRLLRQKASWHAHAAPQCITPLAPTP